MVFVSISKTLAFAALTTLALTSSSANAAGESLQSLPTVRHCVHRALREQGSVNLIVTMKRGTDEVLKHADQGEFASRGDKIESLVSRLEKNAKESQAKLIEDIKRKSTEDKPLFGESQSYWITNQIYFKDASPDLVQVLSEMPDIEEIREEKAIELAGAPQADALPQISRNLTETEVEWNIKMIGAPDVWATGNRGENVVVGVIDTGAIATHEALRDSFRGEYGWFDPIGNTIEPVDGVSHGSHVVGTIVGSHGIGVAPGAKWMMCRGCSSRCLERYVLACAEFMTCPTDPHGNNRDCTKAPRVINNSYGRRGELMRKAVETWRAAGIIPVFAAGNGCTSCGLVAHPAHLDNVIAVGATDKDDGLWSGSCKGPSPTGIVKPDLSAPGDDIRSVSTESNSSYRTEVGTSMAAPHVTGTIALMLSAHPEYTYDQVLAKLRESAATKSLHSSGEECGDTPNTVFPNNQFGSGRLDAAKAMGLAATDDKADPCALLPPRDCMRDTRCLWDQTKGADGQCQLRPSDDDSDRPIWT
ncbi:hypothetical protein ATCC90586_000720 [Pythium insidiosum]|nr:hypothetical protein ATCC90586_000720 [Pythium insidiosum]